ncbi:PEP-CTERM sorting domain-containing protein [Chamaesiphon sp.]|uniref:PEP-CTERM sorting domain-containing protein n=1 Tax=Chamaesiphon sp. TaxID=2814140 RepID=UPI0035938E06
MNRFSIVCGLIIAASLVPVRAIAATFDRIVVYGDSLSDVGRFYTASGNTLPPSPPYDDGRFSNGPVWVEYLATKLGIPNDPSTNFAVGNAKTNSHPQAPAPGFLSIKQQIDSTPSFNDPDDLYVIWGGANDYLDLANPANPSIVVSNLTAQIGTLIGRGAKNILVPNLPNLGQLPNTLGSPAAGLLNSATQAHNLGLAASISALRSTNSDVQLNLLDVNSLFNTASSAGFTNVTDKCITSPSCTPDTYLFWDEVHPTTAGHKLIGDLAFSVVSPTAVPEPITMFGSLAAFSSAIAFKRKLKSSSLKAKELVKDI